MTISLIEPQLRQHGFSLPSPASHLVLALWVLSSLVVVNSCPEAECLWRRSWSWRLWPITKEKPYPTRPQYSPHLFLDKGKTERGSSYFPFVCRSRKSRTRYSISSDFHEKQRDLHFTLCTAGVFRATVPVFWKPSPRFKIWIIMLKLSEFVYYRTKYQMFQGGFGDNFSGYPENWISAPCRWGVENFENSQNGQGWRLSLLLNQGQCLKSLEISKEAFIFMFLEELNQRIRKNEINLRLSCIYLFQNISRLPDHCHKTQRTSLSFRISRIYLLGSHSDHFFRDTWVPLTFFSALSFTISQ